MKKVFIEDLEAGRRVRANFLVRGKTPRIARNGKPYLDLQLQDSTGVIPAKAWDRGDSDVDFEVDDVVFVEGVAEEYQGLLQLRIENAHKSKNESIDLRDLLPATQRDPEEMFVALLSRLGRMPEGPLRSLLLAVCEDAAIAEKFKLAPAATTYHHAYLGGLLEHVLSLVELGDRVCDHYPQIDRDLVLTGVVLHDLGKTEELSYRGGFHYSTRGQLVGHMTIGLEMVNEKIRTIPQFPPALRDQIEHIILSHHGKAEFGSPKEPAFPEALLVHYLDDLDSKLASMREQYAKEKDRAGDWTSRNPALKRELLKRPRDEREDR